MKPYKKVNKETGVTSTIKEVDGGTVIVRAESKEGAWAENKFSEADGLTKKDYIEIATKVLPQALGLKDDELE